MFIMQLIFIPINKWVYFGNKWGYIRITGCFEKEKIAINRVVL